MKVCIKCGIAKPETEFHKDRSRPSGLRPDCKICVTARAAAWNKRNHERHLLNAIRWNRTHKDRRKQYQLTRAVYDRTRALAYYYANIEKCRERVRKWRKANPDKAKAKEESWRRNNKDLVAAYSSARRANKLKATPQWANKEIIRMFFLIAQKKKEETGQSWHVDHIVPLQSPLVCGLHCEYNLQVITGAENDSKSNHYWPDMP